VADYQLIDKTWMIAKDAKSGPFGSIDQIGITTAYDITRNMASRIKSLAPPALPLT
jgi:3-hydroxyacyl-CoA dehydrogenase